jgi:glycosyltransferase involved in cell wall biosynthesis
VVQLGENFFVEDYLSTTSSIVDKKNLVISMIIPIYVNSSGLELLFTEITKLEFNLSKNNISLEVIFVIDGSPDDSLEKIKNAKKKNWKIIILTKNFGAIKAVTAGLNFATGDAFTIVAADLQDPPYAIIELAVLWQKGYKLVIAERKFRGDPFLTRVFSRAYYFLLRKFVVPDFPRKGFDLFLADKELIKYFLDSANIIHPQIFVWSLGFTAAKIELDREKRIEGKSQWTFTKKLNLFIDILFGLSDKPFRLILLVGLSISGLSLTYGIYFLISTIINRSTPPGYASLVILLFLFSGLILLLVGIIGEYLIRIFKIQSKQANFVIDKIYE